MFSPQGRVSSLGTVALGAAQFFVSGCPVQGRMSSSISGLCPVHTSSILSSPVMKTNPHRHVSSRRRPGLG